MVYVICNNRAYRVLKLNMNTYKTHVLGHEEPSSEHIGMDFPLPLDIAAMARSMGVDGKTIEDPADIGPALRTALDSVEPAVLDVVIDGSV